MKLFVRTDLERTARLAVRSLATMPDPELAVAHAVDIVANEAAEVYTRDQLVAIAVAIAEDIPPRRASFGYYPPVDARAIAERAVTAVLGKPTG